jgi:hypothetical protein
MVQRWLHVVVFYYPAYLLATLLILAFPTLIWNYLTDHTVGSWQILRFGIFPNGARLTQLLSSDPNTVLAVVFAQLAALWTISLRARRWSAIAAALLLCPAALIVLPYWVFLFREYRFDAAAGILLSFLTIWRAQGCLLDQRKPKLLEKVSGSLVSPDLGKPRHCTARFRRRGLASRSSGGRDPGSRRRCCQLSPWVG